MRPIAIISKPQRTDLATLLPELVRWLRARGFDPVLDPVSASYVGAPNAIERSEMPRSRPELVIVLGGDGTLLAAARAFAKTDTPIMSVNLGSLGFLTEVRLADLYPTLEGWCEGCCGLDVRSMMHAELWRDGAMHQAYEALNDVVVSKGAIARMGEFSIHLGKQLVASFRADGVIVATPTGSTAYTLAANGPILAPDVNAMVVTPICPHLLTLRPIVVQGDAHLTVNVDAIPDQTYLTVDGQEAIQLMLGDEVRCRRSEHSVHLVRMGEDGFFDVLRSKLKWGER